MKNRRIRSGMLILATAFLVSATDAKMDPDNPTCPMDPNWSNIPAMTLTPVERSGVKVLLAEGRIDRDLPNRLKQILASDPEIAEIWLRSPGGDARAGNEAGRIIRETWVVRDAEGKKTGDKPGVLTRIPANWACFSACNFVFMGGRARIIDEGGLFMVHMFTMTGDRDAISFSVEMGTESTAELIGEVEQDSALLASEDNDFLIRMGVSRKLLTDIMYRQKAVKTSDGDRSTRRCLTRKETFLYNVANIAEETGG
ncbi:hypothetical protein SAMN02745824_2047 [Parasphingorhabdus marina DSM 22363]|uniref:Uncharacterized protein n=1 Tax=Parasphingorhabdus marina DSM 22363 TaxID=1123272 RepID=A0A1N6EQY2_9SPHN|nr:hypothetical protein [Parasphingorhabdus marina]SIN85492.1 hypothetical protein SAMN02745824_2047 [Parasphingorhabdus marina DSM 22363]